MSAPHPFIAILLAESATQGGLEWWQPLVNTGAIGAVLIWFMLRGEKKLDEQARSQKEIAKALNINTRSNMIIVLSLKNLDENVMSLAGQIAQEVEHNERSNEQ